ncbi:MAG TPA: IclR family transcriptional regulator C-terminal domain-containing protein [Acidimicrobiales bacterium]|jgi:IclR family pca regulon transcriptional regulator
MSRTATSLARPGLGGEEADQEARPAEFVQSLERGLSVLRAFSADRPAMTLSEVARTTHLTRATARRLLLTFEALGYMRSDGRYFELTPRVLDLGYAYVSSLKLPDIAQPFMEELSDRIHESVSAAVLDDDEIVYVARVPTKRIMTVSISLGSRLPAATTSLGRALLAELTDGELDAFLARTSVQRLTAHTLTQPAELRDAIFEVRRLGYAVLDQELEIGVRSASTVLRNRRGGAVAAINVSTHAGRVTMKELRTTFVPQLLATAEAITAQLARQ